MAEIIDQEVTTSDIIRQDLERDGLTAKEQSILNSLKTLISQKKAILIRYNNTVFVGIEKGKGVLEVHMYTIDGPRALAEAMQQGIKDIPQAGVNKLVSETENYNLIKMMQKMNLPIKVEKKGNKFAWSMELK